MSVACGAKERRTVSKAKKSTTKLTALAVMHQVAPTPLMSTLAINGPAMRPEFQETLAKDAAPSNASLATKSGVIDAVTGLARDPTIPCPKTMRVSVADPEPAATAKASTAAATA